MSDLISCIVNYLIALLVTLVTFIDSWWQMHACMHVLQERWGPTVLYKLQLQHCESWDTQCQSALWGVWAMVRLFWAQVTPISCDFTAGPPQGRKQASSAGTGEQQNRSSTYSQGSRTGRSLLRVWQWWHLSGSHRCRRDSETEKTPPSSWLH